MNVLEKISKIKWKYLVNRIEGPLMAALTDTSYQYSKELMGINPFVTKTIRLAQGDVLLDQQEIKKLSDYFYNLEIENLFSFKEELIKISNGLKIVAKDIANIDVVGINQSELKEKLELFTEAALKAHLFLVPVPVLEKVLAKRIIELIDENVDEEIKQEWLSVLIYPTEENSHSLEEKSFYNLIEHYQDKDFKKLLKKHLKQFSWIGARWYWYEKAWKKDDILERIEYFVKNKNLEQEKKRIEEIKKEKLSKAKQLEDQLQPSKSAMQFISLAREFAYLRTWRTDNIYQSGYLVKKLFYEIARRAKMRAEDVVYLSIDEIKDMVLNKKNPISEDELNLRKESTTKVTFDNQFAVYSGKEWEEKIRQAVNLDEINENVVKGKIAFPGKVRGKVKIVLNSNDIKKVEKGDILVAIMTFPNFIPAMEKAAAFVTNEGGILCHAAIVSREMKKPCIIATKNATKILHDGDFVEVDAEKGIVKLL